MFRIMNKLINKKKKNNKGAALVMVIVAISFIGMLCSMILYMAYYNYQMKATDKAAKDNFYSAETALDVLNAGLQQRISDSMAEAYVMTMQLSAGMDESQMNQTFQNLYLKSLEKNLAINPGSTPTVYWKRSLVRDIWDSDDMIKAAASSGAEGAWLNTDPTFGFDDTLAADGSGITNNNVLAIATNEIVMKHVNIVYTDNRGYVSMIQTDIRLITPNLDFASAATALNLEDYSLIANVSVADNDSVYKVNSVNHTAGSNVTTTITGNVYGGKEGILVKNESNKLVFGHDASDTKSSFDLVAGSINVDNLAKVTVDDKHRNYFNDINVRSADIDLDGKFLVQDDLNVEGKNSNIKLSGEYKGIGDSNTSAYNSSSILINGAKTDINFSGLTSLFLAGNAYVGARHYDADIERNNFVANGYDASNKIAIADSDDRNVSDKIDNVDEYDKILRGEMAPTTKQGDESLAETVWREYQSTLDQTNATSGKNRKSISSNSADIMTGESVAVKVDQMMYMVPSDCIGYARDTHNQVLGKNPMTYEEYEMLTTTKKSSDSDELMYDLYDLSKFNLAMGRSYNLGVTPVFRRVDGQVMVYLYFNFRGNQAEANTFFKDYYAKNTESFENYVNSYVDTFVWNDKLKTDNTVLSIAGNAFYKQGDDIIMKEENISKDEAKQDAMYDSLDQLKNTFTAMQHMLRENIDEVNSTQRLYTPYENLVDEAALKNTLKDLNYEYPNADPTKVIRAKIVDGDYIYKEADKNNNIKLVVATGNIILENDFDGLAVAGKDIVIGSGCSNITYNAEDVIKALRAKDESGLAKHYAYEVFGPSGIASYEETAHDVNDERVEISEFVVYDNWKKD